MSTFPMYAPTPQHTHLSSTHKYSYSPIPFSYTLTIHPSLHSRTYPSHFCVMSRHVIIPLHPLTCLPIPSPYPIPYPSLTNHASYPTCCCCCCCRCCSLQSDGWTPLTHSAFKGHIEVVQNLLQTPGINVNHADVSIYLLTLSPIVVGGEDEGHLPPQPLSRTLVMMSYYPLNLENIPHH